RTERRYVGCGRVRARGAHLHHHRTGVAAHSRGLERSVRAGAGVRSGAGERGDHRRALRVGVPRDVPASVLECACAEAGPVPAMAAAGTPFPGRDAVIAITFVVIVVTLLGQGFTLAPLMRWLGVRDTGDDERREELAARIGTAEAALARLEELATESWMHPDALSHTRDRYRLRTRHLHGHADGVLDSPIEAKSIAQ